MSPFSLQSNYKTLLHESDDLNNSVKESELIAFLNQGEVNKFQIVQTEDQTYRIIVNIASKEEGLNLVTTRGQKRKWVSLDRLTRHIKEVYKWEENPIIIRLRRNK